MSKVALKLSASLWSADLTNLEAEIQRIEPSDGSQNLSEGFWKGFRCF